MNTFVVGFIAGTLVAFPMFTLLLAASDRRRR